MRVLMGRHLAEVPNSKRLLSDSGSNLLIYLTGHGGDEFFKFQVRIRLGVCLFFLVVFCHIAPSSMLMRA
jgi:hypothetical protein